MLPSPDHPRSRGEHGSLRGRHTFVWGSSPLTRGARHHPKNLMERWGIIPAHAGSTPTQHDPHANDQDHPRSRGEHPARGSLQCRPSGSSPLTRGARTVRRGSCSAQGIIPAHAGSTKSSPGATSSTQDHPRSRGEHVMAFAPFVIPSGSSPLTRGALLLGGVLPDGGRIIPAHAGSTMSCASLNRSLRDHPRSRGEHYCLERTTFRRRGSSPLTRGARIPADQVWDPLRIIPAHAGSTSRPRPASFPAPDHPRSRGEHPDNTHHTLDPDGSSPLTRRALVRGLRRRIRRGIIPAHAGSTVRNSTRGVTLSDHPRSRGEHLVFPRVRGKDEGSSPLTRGALALRIRGSVKLGIIPAHAGSTMHTSSNRPRLADHPRSRGEHLWARQSMSPVMGSSPLTRGALMPQRRLFLLPRIIPAHAGSTCRRVGGWRL